MAIEICAPNSKWSQLCLEDVGSLLFEQRLLICPIHPCLMVVQGPQVDGGGGGEAWAQPVLVQWGTLYQLEFLGRDQKGLWMILGSTGISLYFISQ